MNFTWFADAKARYPATLAVDAMNWPNANANALNPLTLTSCATLQAALGQANPGDMILIESGEYKACELSITRSGTQSQPIVITSKAKALNQSGAVTFSNGSIFAKLKNAASHYVIGGFKFTGQSVSVFTLDAGKIVNGSTYKDGSTNIRFTDNHYEGIGKASGSNEGVIVAGVRSKRIRIDHSSFVSNYNHIRFKNNKDDGAYYSASKDARIDHNYFGPAATNGFIDGVPYEISAIQTCCGAVSENSDALTLTFEHNVVEHARTKHTDGEVVEAKTSGMIVRNNIIWSDNAAVSLRQGFNSSVESNYLVGTGVTVLGANHVVSNNYIDGQNRLKTGIAMPRWGRRQPANCTTLPSTHDNLILQNTVLDTSEYGLRIGDCDYGACRPITDSLISDNYIKSNSGVLAHYNTADEPGRATACNASTISKSYLYDNAGDADGGRNTRNEFTGNVFSKSGSASYGSAFTLDINATVN